MMEIETYRLCFVDKKKVAIHLTTDGTHTLCGRPVAHIAPLTIFTLSLCRRCYSCGNIAWAHELARRAQNKE